MKTYRVLPVNIALVLIGILDLVSTLFWLQTGRATEFNPVMAGLWEIGPPSFVLFKLSTLGIYVAVIEWYRRRRNPEFARRVSSFTVYAYLAIYVISFCLVNFPCLLG